ncbi:MAG: methyltransferase domain-containing protein [Sedimentisphaerales bacterium]|nr:methyltransferase domain-containing protein [Sedimentisphaerales bacterium]
MFDERARDVELLDRPDADRGLVERSYGFMKFANSAGGGTRVVRNFLARELARSNVRSARILDLGSGSAEIPLTLARWGAKHGYRLEFTCLDHHAEALALAQEAAEREGREAIVTERADILDYEPIHEFDYAIGSMFFHHLSAEGIGRVIGRLHGFVRKALLINDLRRCALNYLVCRLLTIGIEPEIRHDALLSIARGFRPLELSMILLAHDPAPRVERHWFCRVAGIVRFDRQEGSCRRF